MHELVASLAFSAGSCGCGQTHTLTSLPKQQQQQQQHQQHQQQEQRQATATACLVAPFSDEIPAFRLDSEFLKSGVGLVGADSSGCLIHRNKLWNFVFIPQERVLHRSFDRGVPVPQIMAREEGMQLVRITVKQIVASSASDHGQNRGGDQQFLLISPRFFPELLGRRLCQTQVQGCRCHPGVRLSG